MKEKIKFYAYVIGSIIVLPFVVYWVVYRYGGGTIDLISGSEVIYFDWRGIPLLFSMIILIAIEVAIISCLFTKDKKVNPVVMRRVNKFLILPSVCFFVSFLSGPLVNIGFLFSSYHSCASSGIFSGIYYVKDKTKCYGLTGVIPWAKGYGYPDNEKK